MLVCNLRLINDICVVYCNSFIELVVIICWVDGGVINPLVLYHGIVGMPLIEVELTNSCMLIRKVFTIVDKIVTTLWQNKLFLDPVRPWQKKTANPADFGSNFFCWSLIVSSFPGLAMITDNDDNEINQYEYVHRNGFQEYMFFWIFFCSEMRIITHYGGIKG